MIKKHRSKTVSGNAKIFRLDPYGMEINDISVRTECFFSIHDLNILIQSKKNLNQ
jgi:hypothetical protein